MGRWHTTRERDRTGSSLWLHLLPWALAFVAVSLGAAWVFRNVRAAVTGVVVVLLYSAWKRRRERRVRVMATVVAALLLLAGAFLAWHVVDTARQRGSWPHDAPAGRSGAR